MEKDSDVGKPGWSFDRRIPLATVIALAAQFGAIVWLAASMSSRLAYLEEYTNELKVARLRERLAVTENASVQVDKKLTRLEDKIDSIADRVGARKD